MQTLYCFAVCIQISSMRKKSAYVGLYTTSYCHDQVMFLKEKDYDRKIKAYIVINCFYFGKVEHGCPITLVNFYPN